MRYIDRKGDVKKIYKDGHPLHGRSVYDPLTIKRKPRWNSPRAKWEYPVSIIKLDAVEYQMEDL